MDFSCKQKDSCQRRTRFFEVKCPSHIDSERFQNPPLLSISTFDSVFESLRFCGVFVQINVNTVSKTEIFLSVLVQKRCSVNGA